MEIDAVARSLIALVVVLGLVGGAAWVGRRFGLTARATARGSSTRRLAVVEVLAIDAKRRLVLIKRDATEHLLLLGATGETVVERNIGPSDSSPALGKSIKPSGAG
ncbi:MAG: flagellar biosynthetic protein FliO [Sphingomonadales bacterium]